MQINETESIALVCALIAIYSSESRQSYLKNLIKLDLVLYSINSSHFVTFYTSLRDLNSSVLSRHVNALLIIQSDDERRSVERGITEGKDKFFSPFERS